MPVKDNQWKSKWKEHLLHKWFSNRMRAAAEEYMRHMEGNPKITELVQYRGIMFNPTTFSPKQMNRNALFVVPEGSDIAEVLDRHIRIKEDITDATGNLTWLLNYCDDLNSFKFLMGFTNEGTKELIEFKEANKDVFMTFKRYELLHNLL